MSEWVKIWVASSLLLRTPSMLIDVNSEWPYRRLGWSKKNDWDVEQLLVIMLGYTPCWLPV